MRRDKARGEAIPADVLAKVRGTELDTGVYLDTSTHRVSFLVHRRCVIWICSHRVPTQGQLMVRGRQG